MTHEGTLAEVVIATTIDDRWVPHFATCVTTLAASRGAESVRIIMLQGPSLSTASIDALREFVEGLGMAFEAIPIPAHVDAALPPTSTAFSPLVWYRLLLPEILPDIDRVLFLDADTLVLQSLAPLFDTDIGDNLLGAVGTAGPTDEHMRTLGLDIQQPYLNAGVILMDLARMRAERFGQLALSLGHQRSAEFVFNDQDVLNVLANGRWTLLHPRWNAMSRLWLRRNVIDPGFSPLEMEAARLSPAIVHFEGHQTVKPWFYRSVHPLRHLYREFRSQTPWPLDVLEGRSLVNAVLRQLPIGWQYAITRAKSRIATRLRAT